MTKTLRILGTHGVPAAYGGFETAAENIALFLVRQGWRVIVYCQAQGRGPITDDVWQGIERVHVPVTLDIVEDLGHALTHNAICLGSLRLLQGIYEGRRATLH